MAGWEGSLGDDGELGVTEALGKVVKWSLQLFPSSPFSLEGTLCPLGCFGEGSQPGGHVLSRKWEVRRVRWGG